MDYSVSELATNIDNVDTQVIYLFAQQKGVVIGILRLEVYEGAGWISSLFVEETHRKQGIAASLLEEAFTRCRTAGFQTVGLLVKKENEGAIRLYKQLGFKVFLGSEQTHMQMIKIL